MKLNPENADLLTTPYWELPLHKKLSLIREILYNSFPNIIAYVVGPIVNIINVYFLSKHGGDEVVAGFGVGLVYCGAFIVALVVTFNQAGNVLMAQAFGAKNNRLCGIYFQRSLILMIGILIPLSFMLIFADKIMSLIPFDEKLVGIAADYVRLSMPSVIGLSCFDIMKSFITSQKVFYPIIYIQLSNLALHYIWVKIFIEGMEMGIEGAALIRNIEDWTVTIMIFVYIKMSGKFKETWIPWTKEAFNKESLWSQVKFSVPIAVMTYFIWFYFELMTMISGTFGAKYVVAHVSVANTSGINYTIGMGISVTVMTYIANSVGKQAITEAKNYFYAGMSILVPLSVFAVTFLLSIRDLWASLWTVDSDTQAYLIDVFVVFCLFSLWVDHVNNAQLGLLKAIGRQKIASMMTFVTLYPIGIPLLILVAFVFELRVIGLWLAFGIANVVLFIWGRKKISEVDWDQVMAESKERLNAEGKSGEDVELWELSSADGNPKRLLEEDRP